VQRPDLDLHAYHPDDKGVSRCHVKLQPEYERLSVIDLASTNGTWLNGTRIMPNLPVSLQDGDVISLAGLSFAVQIISTPADLGMRRDAGS
jgi:pSer/pThr/pTyr-binding forkhead associated (FHA) protein